METKKKRGGYRPGAGRPKKDDAKKSLSVRVSVEVYNTLYTYENKSKVVEDALLAYFKDNKKIL